MERNTPGLTRLISGRLAKRGIRPHEESDPVYAYADLGRWLADCLCNGAELVKEGEPFVCGTCGAVRSVVWPEECAEIEELLNQREVKNRNWRLGEPVENLVDENVRHGA